MRVTTDELVDRVLTAIDMEDGYATPAMVLRIINAAHPRFLFMLQSLGWVHNPIREEFTLQATTTSYTPTYTPMSILGLYTRSPGGDWQPVQSESAGYAPRSDNYNGSARYSMHEETASIVPATLFNLGDEPTAPSITVNGGTAGDECQLVYIAEPATLYLEADALTWDLEVGDARLNQLWVDFPNGWEEWLVMDAAITLAGREETTNTTMIARKAEIAADITQMVTNRMMADGPRIKNIDGVKRPMWTSSARISRSRY